MESSAKFASVLILLALSGCASTISAVTNRSIAAHEFRPGRIFSMTGERRLAMTVQREDGRVVMCAESLPEVAAAVAASSSASASLVNQGSGALSDAFQTQLLQTFTRTEISEVLRQVSWQLCQAWAQGALQDDEYQAELHRLVTAGIDVMKARAAQQIQAAPSAGQRTTVVTVPAGVTAPAVVVTVPHNTIPAGNANAQQAGQTQSPN
jgi:hypothetical protein